MSIAASFEIEYLQYLGPDGTLVRNDLPEAGRDVARLRELFKQMLFVRTFDTKSVALQRTGKLGTYASCLGHEATHVGIGASMRPEDTCTPPVTASTARMFMRGVKPARSAAVLGRRRTRQRFRPRQRRAQRLFRGACQSPPSACMRPARRWRSSCAVSNRTSRSATCGDGGSSKTDFYAALNSGGAYSSCRWCCA